MLLGELFAPRLYHRPLDGLVEDDAERRDVLVVAVEVDVLVAVMVVVAVMMVVVAAGAAGHLDTGVVVLAFEPGLRIEQLVGGIDGVRTEQHRRLDLPVLHSELVGSGIELVQPCLQHPNPRRVREVRFRDQDAVRDRRLPDRFPVTFELRPPVHPVHRRDQRIQTVGMLEQRVPHEAGDDGKRIGETGGLDHDPGERRKRSGHALEIQLPHAVHQLALHRAADAAGLEQHDVVVQLLHHEVIEPDLAELVDQHRRLLHPGMGEEVVEQRRLAAAEKAGDERDRDRCGRVAVRARGARAHCSQKHAPERSDGSQSRRTRSPVDTDPPPRALTPHEPDTAWIPGEASAQTNKAGAGPRVAQVRRSD